MLHRFLARTIARVRDFVISENVTANQVSKVRIAPKRYRVKRIVPEVEACVEEESVNASKHIVVSSVRTSRTNRVVRKIVTSNEVKDSVIKDPVSVTSDLKENLVVRRFRRTRRNPPLRKNFDFVPEMRMISKQHLFRSLMTS